MDEIGELPLLLQVKILRFLQESTIERVGGTKTIALNVRIIAATNINLEDAVKQGTFREDLFYRLNVVPLWIPDLNERPEDTLLLAQNFLLEETRKLQRGQTSFSQAAIAALTAHDRLGKVSEHQNRIRRALALSGNNISQAARLLEISRPTLHDLLKKHGISIKK